MYCFLEIHNAPSPNCMVFGLNRINPVILRGASTVLLRYSVRAPRAWNVLCTFHSSASYLLGPAGPKQAASSAWLLLSLGYRLRTYSLSSQTGLQSETGRGQQGKASLRPGDPACCSSNALRFTALDIKIPTFQLADSGTPARPEVLSVALRQDVKY